jgi:predicted  nucleic acid-binding Zn-ribbon protein
MNQPLNALMRKLNWQLNELNLHLHESQTQSQSLTEQIQEIDDHINQARPKPLVINPDLEMSRLNFMTQEANKKDELSAELKNHQDVESKLKEKIQRVKTELKMLEKYLEREESSHNEQQKKAHDNALDEWVIQKMVSL